MRGQRFQVSRDRLLHALQRLRHRIPLRDAPGQRGDRHDTTGVCRIFVIPLQNHAVGSQARQRRRHGDPSPSQSVLRGRQRVNGPEASGAGVDTPNRCGPRADAVLMHSGGQLGSLSVHRRGQPPEVLAPGGPTRPRLTPVRILWTHCGQSGSPRVHRVDGIRRNPLWHKHPGVDSRGQRVPPPRRGGNQRRRLESPPR